MNGPAPDPRPSTRLSPHWSPAHAVTATPTYRPALRYVPGGRWERILTVAAREPIVRADMVHAVSTGEFPHQTERRKVWRALNELEDLGLIARAPGGFVTTARGAQALWEGSMMTAKSIS